MVCKFCSLCKIFFTYIYLVFKNVCQYIRAGIFATLVYWCIEYGRQSTRVNEKY